MMNAGGRRKTHAVARRLRLRGHLSGTAINPRPVTLLDNRLRDSVGKQLAILPIARLIALGAVAQESTLYQDGGTRCEAQDTKICRVHSAIRRVRDGHQLGLNQAGQLE